MRLAIEAYRAGDRPRARELLDASAAKGQDRYAADHYVGLGLAADLTFDEGLVDEGFEMLNRAVELAAAAGDIWWQSDSLLRITERALELGRLDDAGPAGREALRLTQAVGDRQYGIWALGMLAWEAAAAGLANRAGRIWGGLEIEVERGAPMGQWELQQEEFRARVAGLAGEDFEPGRADGRSLSFEAVVAEALRLS
jgi:hypothetical protein